MHESLVWEEHERKKTSQEKFFVALKLEMYHFPHYTKQ